MQLLIDQLKVGKYVFVVDKIGPFAGVINEIDIQHIGPDHAYITLCNASTQQIGISTIIHCFKQDHEIHVYDSLEQLIENHIDYFL